MVVPGKRLVLVFNGLEPRPSAESRWFGGTGVVRRRLPQPAEPSAGERSAQAPDRRAETGLGCLIRNAEIRTAKSPPYEIHTRCGRTT